MNTYTYRGYTIKPNPYVDGKPWYIQTYHNPTGIPWDAQECPQFYSLRQAREEIEYWQQQTQDLKSQT